MKTTTMKNKMTTEQLTEQYADFISHIYRYDVDNQKEYEKVEGLMEAMSNIYNSYTTRDFFLMSCIVKEINKITRKRKKDLAVSK